MRSSIATTGRSRRVSQAARDALALYVKISHGEVTGFIGKKRGPIQALEGSLRSIPDILGNKERWGEWFGIKGAEDIGSHSRFRNNLRGGSLDFRLEGFEFMTGGQLSSYGNYAIHSDGTPEFAGCVVDQAEGLGNVYMPLELTESGAVSAQESFSLNGDFEGFNGDLLITCSDGMVSAVGTADFKGDDFSGTVTLSLDTVEHGYQLLESFVAGHHPDGTLEIPRGDDESDGLALTASGILDFDIDEWLAGRVSVFVGPDGEVTAAGEWLPTAEIAFLEPPDDLLVVPESAPFVLFDTDIIDVPVPYFFGLFAGVWAKADVRAMLGPGRVHSLRASGVVSTADYITPSLSVGGAVELLGQGEFSLGVYGNLSAAPREWEVLSLRLGVEGTAFVPVRVEADQDISVFASRQEDRSFDAYIEGSVTAQGGVVVRLNGNVAFESLLGDVEHDFGEIEFPIAGGEIDINYRSELGGESEVSASPHFALAEVSPDLVIAEFTGAGEDPGEQEAWGDTPDDPMLTEYTPPPEHALEFDMEGMPHTMFLTDPIESPPIVLMESKRDVLHAKIKARRDAIKAAESNKSVESELRFLEYIDHQVSVVEKNAERVSDKSAEEGEWAFDPKTMGFGLLVDLVSEYGELYKKSDIAGGVLPSGGGLKHGRGARTRWNPEGLGSNCGFCVMSIAHERRSGELRTAAELYDDARIHMGDPNANFSHWLILPGSNSRVMNSEDEALTLDENMDEFFPNRVNEWSISHMAEELLGITYKLQSSIQDSEWNQLIVLSEGEDRLENWVDTWYDDMAENDPRFEDLDEAGEANAKARYRDGMKKNVKQLIGEYFMVAPSKKHFQYLEIEDDLEVKLYDPQRSDTAIATGSDVLAWTSGAGLYHLNNKK